MKTKGRSVYFYMSLTLGCAKLRGIDPASLMSGAKFVCKAAWQGTISGYRFQ